MEVEKLWHRDLKRIRPTIIGGKRAVASATSPIEWASALCRRPPLLPQVTSICGNKFSVQDGVVKEKGVVYRCPFCKGNVRSDVRTGRINHRTVCGNQFYVKDSAVSKNTRCHAHSCPVCSTVVWSSQSCGRIAVTHVTPSGKRCQMKH